MTAYEMRISDWSSDLCSSDLRHDRAAEDGVAYAGELRPGASHHRRAVALLQAARRALEPRRQRLGRRRVVEQNGRAACREKVWQYEKTWGVAASVKKTNNDKVHVTTTNKER